LTDSTESDIRFLVGALRLQSFERLLRAEPSISARWTRQGAKTLASGHQTGTLESPIMYLT
jgi:hypothetical protein